MTAVAKEVRRALKLEGADIMLEISRVTALDVPRPFLFLWEEADHTWKVEYSTAFLKTFAALKSLEFSAEEPVDPKKKAKKQYPAFINVHLREEYDASENELSELLIIGRTTGISGERGTRFIHLNTSMAHGVSATGRARSPTSPR